MGAEREGGRLAEVTLCGEEEEAVRLNGPAVLYIEFSRSVFVVLFLFLTEKATGLISSPILRGTSCYPVSRSWI